MLTLDECIKLAQDCFPTILRSNKEYESMVSVLGYALYRNYSQIGLLRYAYYPQLADDLLLPKIADTLGFDYPINYDKERLRLILTYLSKIKRNRGTVFAIKALIRLLLMTEKDILNLKKEFYANIEVDLSYRPGYIYIRYDKITADNYEELTNFMRLVIPAGFNYCLEGTASGDFKRKFDSNISFSESVFIIKNESRIFRIDFKSNFDLSLNFELAEDIICNDSIAITKSI